MTQETDNHYFAQVVQCWLGLPIDGWAGPQTLKAFREKTGTTAPAQSVVHLLEKPEEFYASLKLSFGGLSQTQVDGFNAIVAAMADWPLYDAAYGLATAWWETAKTMQPVKEAYWLSEGWRKANLRYYPWYGRGYVQTTWEDNYLRTDKELDLGGTLVANPDRLLEPAIAAPAMVRGMVEGWYTGKKNSDHQGRDYVNRRKMINGTDKAAEIAQVAEKMEAALVAGGW